VNERKRLLQLIEHGRAKIAVESLLRRKLSKPAEVDFVHRCAAAIFQGVEFDAALPLYAKLIEHNPLDADALFAYSRMQRIDSTDPILAALSLATQHADKMSISHKIKLAYTLGKVHQDLGSFAQAYAAFKSGAQLHARAFPYDRQSNFALMADVVATLTDKLLAPLTNPESLGQFPRPIFVLGMPRSGSTLVEQILASHPEVTAAGEVKYFQAAVQSVLIGDKQTLAAAAPHWTKQTLMSCACDYLEKISKHAAGKSYVVDKLPGNFLFVGLIRAVLPHAIILHTERDPYACLWSNYSTLFGDEMHYTYDLDVLGAYYQNYCRVMTHWSEECPEDYMNVGYEQLVQGGEEAIRRLVETVGLSWDEACGKFYETKRAIKTASVAQAREPLYTTSVDAWRNYEPQLRPTLGRYFS
jgi:hypothetical protein